MSTKIVIAGGTGLIGSYVSRRFRKLGYEVVVVSRRAGEASWQHDELVTTLEGAELVLNLAGKSINCKFNEVNKRLIVESRVNTTRAIGNAIKACENPPKLWINASASAIYPCSESVLMTEDVKELSDSFLSLAIQKWESSFFDFRSSNIRQVALRTSVVLAKGGGALTPLLALTEFGLGGAQGSGRQMFSWIHIEDYFRILNFILENDSVNGIVNCTAPYPVSNRILMRTIRRNLEISIGLPAPSWLIKLGAVIVGTESELILNSVNLYPQRLLEKGFKFLYPDIDSALLELV